MRVLRLSPLLLRILLGPHCPVLGKEAIQKKTKVFQQTTAAEPSAEIVSQPFGTIQPQPTFHTPAAAARP